MSNGNNFNFNADNQQNQIGDNNTQNMHISKETTVTVEELLSRLQNEVTTKELSWEDLGNPEGISCEYSTPEQFLQDAQQHIEAEPVFGSENFEEQETSEWFEKFKRFLPFFIKGTAEVGLAIAKTYTENSPVVAGLVAAFDYVRKNLNNA